MSTKSLSTMLVVLFFTILFDQAGVLIILPILPDMLHEVTGKSLSNTAQIGGLLAASYALMQLVFGPIVGRLSDHYGRRKILVTAAFIFIFDYLIMATANKLWVLFLGRILAGIVGACLVTALACVADISSPENKTKNYSIVFAAMGLGLIVGPAISSVAMRIGGSIGIGIRAPFYFAMAIAILNFLMILFLMPETLSEDKRSIFKLENPLRSLFKFARYPGLKEMFISYFIFLTALQAPFILMSFFVEAKFNWKPVQTSDLFIWLGFVIILVQVILVPRLYPKLGNIKICYLGSIVMILSMLAIAMAYDRWSLYFACTLFSCSAISNSAFSSLTTSQVKDTEQGELQGVMASIMSLATIIGLLVMTDLFRISVEKGILFKESNPFILAGLLGMGSLIYTGLSFKKLLYKA